MPHRVFPGHDAEIEDNIVIRKTRLDKFLEVLKRRHGGGNELVQPGHVNKVDGVELYADIVHAGLGVIGDPDHLAFDGHRLFAVGQCDLQGDTVIDE